MPLKEEQQALLPKENTSLFTRIRRNKVWAICTTFAVSASTFSILLWTKSDIFGSFVTTIESIGVSTETLAEVMLGLALIPVVIKAGFAYKDSRKTPQIIPADPNSSVNTDSADEEERAAGKRSPSSSLAYPASRNPFSARALAVAPSPVITLESTLLEALKTNNFSTAITLIKQGAQIDKEERTLYYVGTAYGYMQSRVTAPGSAVPVAILQKINLSLIFSSIFFEIQKSSINSDAKTALTIYFNQKENFIKENWGGVSLQKLIIEIAQFGVRIFSEMQKTAQSDSQQNIFITLLKRTAVLAALENISIKSAIQETGFTVDELAGISCIQSSDATATSSISAAPAATLYTPSTFSFDPNTCGENKIAEVCEHIRKERYQLAINLIKEGCMLQCSQDQSFGGSNNNVLAYVNSLQKIALHIKANLNAGLIFARIVYLSEYLIAQLNQNRETKLVAAIQKQLGDAEKAAPLSMHTKHSLIRHQLEMLRTTVFAGLAYKEEHLAKNIRDAFKEMNNYMAGLLQSFDSVTEAASKGGMRVW
jgi:hypothetical protein